MLNLYNRANGVICLETDVFRKRLVWHSISPCLWHFL